MAILYLSDVCLTVPATGLEQDKNTQSLKSEQLP